MREMEKKKKIEVLLVKYETRLFKQKNSQK